MKIPKTRGLVSQTSPVSPTASQSSTIAIAPPAVNPFLVNSVVNIPDDAFSSLRSLELMHKFSTETYKSLSNDPSDYSVWQMEIPRKALEHDFLLSGILAIAALHTATSIEGPMALSYVDTALEYHNVASAPYRLALDNLTPLNCDAVFAHSIITTVIGISLPRLTASRDESSNMTENIIVVFELLQGVKKIIWISKPWLHARLFNSRHELWKDNLLEPEPDADSALAELAALNDKMAAIDPEQHRINRDAILFLRRCYSRHVIVRDAASVLTWLAAVDKDFVDRLRRRQPFPLFVLMHWAVLLGELDGKMWWARNSGKALITELSDALQHDILQWGVTQLWPREKMGL